MLKFCHAKIGPGQRLVGGRGGGGGISHIFNVDSLGEHICMTEVVQC